MISLIEPCFPVDAKSHGQGEESILLSLFLIFFFMVGFFIWGHWTAFCALLPDIVPYEILGMAFGLTNPIRFLGSLAAPRATGWGRGGRPLFPGDFTSQSSSVFLGEFSSWLSILPFVSEKREK